MEKQELLEKCKAAGDSTAIVDGHVLYYNGHVYKSRYDYYGEFVGLKTCCGLGSLNGTRQRGEVCTVRDALEREDLCGNCERTLLSRTDFTVKRVALADDEELAIEKS